MTAIKPYFDDGQVSLYLGDCLDVLAGIPDDTVDSVVTDPPYGLAELSAATALTAIAAWMAGDRTHVPDGRGFMGREWDSFVPPPGAWDECMRVLKPGGHLLSFAGSRTVDLMTLSIRIAGFEIRDSIDWIYGSGFPKSLDVSKAIDRRRTDEIGHVCAFLGAAIEASGMPRKAIGGHMGIDPRGVDLWAPGPSDKSAQARAHIPTWEQWERLRELLGFGGEMDAEVWRLNGRKGMPGDAWVEREVIGTAYRVRRESTVQFASLSDGEYDITAAATEDAARWEGWGTALKPAHEPIVVARKPLAGTVAANVLEHGTGAVNIDACRVEFAGAADLAESEGKNRHADYGSGPRGNRVFGGDERDRADQGNYDGTAGRWPPNVLLGHSADCEPTGVKRVRGITGGTGNHDGSVYGARSNAGAPVRDYADADGTETVEAWDCADDCPVAELDRQSAGTRAAKPSRTGNAGRAAGEGVYGGGSGLPRDYAAISRSDAGGASRFFPAFRWQAKAPASERPRLEDGTAHPTVKPLDLMRWLVRLVTPPGGTVADPFAGSGTTGEACVIEGFNCILVEKDPASAELIKARLSKPIQPDLFGGGAA